MKEASILSPEQKSQTLLNWCDYLESKALHIELKADVGAGLEAGALADSSPFGVSLAYKPTISFKDIRAIYVVKNSKKYKVTWSKISKEDIEQYIVYRSRK